MIICPLCGTRNSDLTTVCHSCRGFLQGKVDALDLFSTVWMLIETPTRALRRIAISRHKNYTVVLSGLFGIAWSFALYWLLSASDAIGNLFILLSMAILAGPPIGVVLVMLMAFGMVSAAKIVKAEGGVKNSFAVIAYSMVPVVLSMLFVLPVALGVFGSFLFGTNPPPSLLNGPIYYVILGLFGASILWALQLMIRAGAIATASRGFTTVVIASAAVTVLSAITWAAVIGGEGIIGGR